MEVGEVMVSSKKLENWENLIQDVFLAWQNQARDNLTKLESLLLYRKLWVKMKQLTIKRDLQQDKQ